MEDRVWRAYGLLKYARTITSNDAMTYISDLRLGVDLEIIPDIPRSSIMELIITTRPAFLNKLNGEELNPQQRDVYRATLIRERLKTI